MKRLFPALNVQELISKEWLLPFGNGGYASGCISGMKSRSYHGLLVAALPNPLDRILALSHIDVTYVSKAGEEVQLACHLYGDGVVHPQGAARLVDFRFDVEPRWTWTLGDADLECVLTTPGENTIDVSYHLRGELSGELFFHPFVAWRSHHGGDSPGFSVHRQTGRVSIRHQDQDFILSCDHTLEFIDEQRFHENFRYERELERGLRGHEDLRSPLALKWTPSGAEPSTTMRWSVHNANSSFRLPIIKPSIKRGGGGVIARLERATRDFLIRNPDSGAPGIVAGYPWFNEWGRDTMIALPGLAYALQDQEIIDQILLSWGESIKNGLLPNRLAEDERAASYNSADAPLHFLRCIERFYDQSEHKQKLRRFVASILDSYLAGTDYGIGVDSASHLLVSGNAETQLTWMDACHEGICFTPRFGASVELNALLLRGLIFGAALFHDSPQAAKYHDAAAALRIAFSSTFYDAKHGLSDCTSDSVSKLRPNLLFALSKGLDLVSPPQAQKALEQVEKFLLTPFGLRSLSPEDPDYCGTYEGGPSERDASYHQGTVWMWLLGPYIDAVMAVRGVDSKTRQLAENCVALALQNLDKVCLHQLNEIFDGDAPHQPRGAVAQAWSAAELLRVVYDWKLSPLTIERRLGELCSSDSPAS